MHQIRAITIDLDDTLWEIAPVIRRAEAELWRWMERHRPAVCRRFTAEAMVKLRDQVIEEYWQHTHDFRFLRRIALTRMLESCGYTDDCVDEAFEVFDRFRNRVELFPDVLPSLERLSERFTVVAVTNGNANLQTIGIRHLFSDVVSAVEVGAAKPAPRIFGEALRRAGASAGETLHVGDHPECDIAGAQGAGLRTAWMNRTGDTWPQHLRAPDAIVTTVSELREILGPGVTAASGR